MERSKNILLYWDDRIPSLSVRKVFEAWQVGCPAWNVQIFCKDDAHDFLKDKFGKDIARMFLTCAIPAMRSDFFRVFWALSEGGIYSDITFVPKHEPLFFFDNKNITLVRWHHGRIVNGIFFAKPNCAEVKMVAYEIMKAISQRHESNVWLATGPGAWIRAIGMQQTDTVGIVDRAFLFERFIRASGFESSTRNSNLHWSKLQEANSIYTINESGI